MRAIIISFLLFHTATTRAGDAAEPTYCEPPTYTVMNQKPNNRALSLPLLSDHEKRDPAAGRQLASEPGPYGHSELGFRYLSRLFGYEGDFGEDSQAAVEKWVGEQELKGDPARRGTWDAWQQWVTEPVKRLSVPSGSINKIFSNTGPEIFFANPRDQANFQSCVQNDLSFRACKNYLGDREPEAGDRVYFGNTGSVAACKLVRNDFGYEKRREKLANKLLQSLGGSSGASSRTSNARDAR